MLTITCPSVDVLFLEPPNASPEKILIKFGFFFRMSSSVVWNCNKGWFSPFGMT